MKNIIRALFVVVCVFCVAYRPAEAQTAEELELEILYEELFYLESVLNDPPDAPWSPTTAVHTASCNDCLQSVADQCARDALEAACEGGELGEIECTVMLIREPSCEGKRAYVTCSATCTTSPDGAGRPSGYGGGCYSGAC